MKAIINTYAKSQISHLNGLTFDVVGHCQNEFNVEVDKVIHGISIKEVIIVDIVNEFRHAQIRFDALGFDYWFQFLRNYIKENKIKFSLTEISKVKYVEPIIEDTFVEINDSEIL